MSEKLVVDQLYKIVSRDCTRTFYATCIENDCIDEFGTWTTVMIHYAIPSLTMPCITPQYLLIDWYTWTPVDRKELVACILEN